MITRFIHSQIKKRLFRGKAIILYRPRQVGKTTLIKSILIGLPEAALSLDGDETDVREMLSNTTFP